MEKSSYICSGTLKDLRDRERRYLSVIRYYSSASILELESFKSAIESLIHNANVKHELGTSLEDSDSGPILYLDILPSQALDFTNDNELLSPYVSKRTGLIQFWNGNGRMPIELANKGKKNISIKTISANNLTSKYDRNNCNECGFSGGHITSILGAIIVCNNQSIFALKKITGYHYKKIELAIKELKEDFDVDIKVLTDNKSNKVTKSMCMISLVTLGVFKNNGMPFVKKAFPCGTLSFNDRVFKVGDWIGE